MAHALNCALYAFTVLGCTAADRNVDNSVLDCLEINPWSLRLAGVIGKHKIGGGETEGRRSGDRVRLVSLSVCGFWVRGVSCGVQAQEITDRATCSCPE